ncbi:hypothetical protein ZIOFF_006251 [Zingiber officinale]|uniref:Reverse transcriptase domain-containing protein n=1 Tax=Zingiber officinale TaxID=94328 RepID=A0A8J5LS73_ZINOF|nr:hypothetical protein ZIOFF_006251 [Zingiber officinale]
MVMEIPPTGWDDEVDETNSQKEESVAASERYSSTTEPHILINKITPNAVTPSRRSEGSAGLDISASHASIIEPYGRDLIHTGLRIEIPCGYYGRLASRSGLGWKTGIEVGAGVIDSDYRGEVQVPDGLYEWLVMPFGLKNEPAVFQRKMDACFKGTEDFIAVYIDDILVFSPDEKSHEQHLQKMLSICQKNGLILSPMKMKIAVPEIEFLGAIIGNCRIKLQPHVITKIADFNDNELKTTKGMRSWLGLLNYARNYIPNLGKLLGPLYAKTSPNGERKLNQQDWDLIHQLKTKVRQLPDLEIPPPECYMILEVDGCMDGWGGICKWKKKKFDPVSSEKICAYSSGKFNPPKSTIDAECSVVLSCQIMLYFSKVDA